MALTRYHIIFVFEDRRLEKHLIPQVHLCHFVSRIHLPLYSELFSKDVVWRDCTCNTYQYITTRIINGFYAMVLMGWWLGLINVSCWDCHVVAELGRYNWYNWGWIAVSRITHEVPCLQVLDNIITYATYAVRSFCQMQPINSNSFLWGWATCWSHVGWSSLTQFY